MAQGLWEARKQRGTADYYFMVLASEEGRAARSERRGAQPQSDSFGSVFKVGSDLNIVESFQRREGEIQII